jgi:4-amino-4-deoxychorismate lyase
MYPFFETIRYKNGVLENLAFHQQRVDRTFMQFKETVEAKEAPNALNLSTIQVHGGLLTNQVYKCRVKYNLASDFNIAFEPYTIRSIKNCLLTEIGDNKYDYKYTDRDWLNEALLVAATDEIIFTSAGFIKDASYANLAFFDGSDWFTPKNPLLLGTRRAALIEKGIINEIDIRIADLYKYKSIKLINAMMLWEESPTLNLNFDSVSNTLEFQ